MSRFTTLLFAAGIGIGCVAAVNLHGTSSLIHNAQAATKAERAEAAKAKREEAAEKRAEQKQKRADCDAQAKEQKLGLLKRARFVRECMKPVGPQPR